MRVSITALVRVELPRAIAELPVEVRTRRCRGQAEDVVELTTAQQARRQTWEGLAPGTQAAVSYTHLRAHETSAHL
eukprot:12387233-Alexandrium_andersonii.AAC.1